MECIAVFYALHIIGVNLLSFSWIRFTTLHMNILHLSFYHDILMVLRAVDGLLKNRPIYRQCNHKLYMSYHHTYIHLSLCMLLFILISMWVRLTFCILNNFLLVAVGGLRVREKFFLYLLFFPKDGAERCERITVRQNWTRRYRFCKTLDAISFHFFSRVKIYRIWHSKGTYRRSRYLQGK